MEVVPPITPRGAAAAPGAAAAVPRADGRTPPETEAFQRSPEDAVTRRLERAIAGMEATKRTLAERLAAMLVKERDTLDWRIVRGRCVVQLLLVQSIADIAASHYERLSLAHIESLLTSLELAQQFAAEANRNAALRRAAQTSGVLRLFVKQEVDSALGLLRFLLRLYAEGIADATKEKLAEQKLLGMCEALVAEVGEADKPEHAQNPEAQLYAAAKVPLVQAMLKGVSEFSAEQFSRNLGRLYPLLTELIVSGTRDQRLVVRELFARLGATLLPKKAEA